MSYNDESPYVRKLIKEIKPSDIKITVIGKIKQNLGDNRVVIDDGTGQTTIIIKNMDPILDKIRNNMIIKVLGQIKGDMPDIISADVVADYSDLNLDLYKKSVEISRQYLD